VNAVDSEFNQSLQHDGWHYFNLTQALSNPEGNYNRFDCGNLKSLSDPKIREALLDFHKKWYSANIMTLVICGKYDLETMEQWVTSRFSAIVNKDVVVPDLGVPKPFPAECLGKVVKYVPVKDKNILTLFFSLTFLGQEHKTQPYRYFSKIIGDEGQHSLTSYLKDLNLALSLNAGVDHSMDCMSMFEIEVELTQ